MADFQMALKIAKQQAKANLKTTIERAIQDSKTKSSTSDLLGNFLAL